MKYLKVINTVRVLLVLTTLFIVRGLFKSVPLSIFLLSFWYEGINAPYNMISFPSRAGMTHPCTNRNFAISCTVTVIFLWMVILVFWRP